MNAPVEHVLEPEVIEFMLDGKEVLGRSDELII